ncbi:hypothetical protein [Corallococcus sp. 4LFB]|uniref:hypothetical protein n=1 Tax=Corallococcus sp. 4LFB TaxID=3383249 RepID=UPI0039768AB8
MGSTSSSVVDVQAKVPSDSGWSVGTVYAETSTRSMGAAALSWRTDDGITLLRLPTA